jgi:hypothetical protein
LARRSLRPHLNQIRSWVRQGRTDAWIAHQLEVTVQQIQSFKREQDLEPESADNGEAGAAVDFDDEIDLRAEDDALIAAELDAAEAAKAEEDEDSSDDTSDSSDDDDDEKPAEKPKRRRGRRGGGTRRRTTAGDGGALEATFDHGEEGYGLWLDPAVADNPVYAEHWAGHRPVEVTIEEDQIVIRRAGASDDS